MTRKISLLRIEGYFEKKFFLSVQHPLEKTHLKSKGDLKYLFLLLLDPELRAVSLKCKLFVELQCTWAEHTGRQCCSQALSSHSRETMDEFASDPTVLKPSSLILQLLSCLIGRTLSHSIS